MLTVALSLLVAVSLPLTKHGVLAAPQHVVNGMSGSFKLPLERRLSTGSTNVQRVEDGTGARGWFVDVSIRDQTFFLELDTGPDTT